MHLLFELLFLRGNHSYYIKVEQKAMNIGSPYNEEPFVAQRSKRYLKYLIRNALLTYVHLLSVPSRASFGWALCYLFASSIFCCCCCPTHPSPVVAAAPTRTALSPSLPLFLFLFLFPFALVVQCCVVNVAF